jgi:hypothetical protein
VSRKGRLRILIEKSVAEATKKLRASNLRGEKPLLKDLYVELEAAFDVSLNRPPSGS